MQKSKKYEDIHFNAETISAADSLFFDIAKPISQIDYEQHTFSVDHEDCSWHYDSMAEFLADYRKFSEYAFIRHDIGRARLDITRSRRSTTVIVMGLGRADIERVFDVLERAAPTAKLAPIPVPPAPVVAPVPPTIFVGHGRSSAWRELKDHLQDKHKLTVEAYETGARAGHTIRDILDDMVKKSSFAILVLTGEDEQSDGKMRARQNVVHEAGIFQGRLGFPRAIMLIEDGVEPFSNIHGIQHIGFSAGRIKETFGEVLATLKREFP